ncbi:hypothetical protein KTO58_09485 [Chitinophaga pendula]|uniref:hypothetical protein n=1 Tax=Chitinophaga TaxID=79328 RepID=UPI000BAEB756|nr:MULTISPECIES: hypothetical protein [Chitinophaga]ASZ12972.1 hypothetical protein CK934_19415 [Chitinophaga sp. MD30]UCJ09395.1 hypothetical protein KTO58_09485 [Chitinophaga pendula]
MFGFFHKKIDYSPQIENMQQIRQRWLTFLHKLDERVEELYQQSLPTLKELFNEDEDPYKRAHGRMLAGISGQLSNMRTKANDVKEEQIIPVLYSTQAVDLLTKEGRQFHDQVEDFRNTCFLAHDRFEDKINKYQEHLRATGQRHDLEQQYEQELRAFETIKDQFKCHQCGGNISIPGMFFIATYVTCSYCHTQNTFMPSTGAQMVLHNARAIAELRTAHLLAAYEQSAPKDKELYRQYLRAMFDEWNKIVPDMTAENEKFYQRLLQDSFANHHY